MHSGRCENVSLAREAELHKHINRQRGPFLILLPKIGTSSFVHKGVTRGGKMEGGLLSAAICSQMLALSGHPSWLNLGICNREAQAKEKILKGPSSCYVALPN